MLKKFDLLLSEILREKNLLAPEVLDPLMQETDSSGCSLQQLLVKKGLFQEKEILSLLSEKLKISYVDLRDICVDKNVLDKVPVKIASYYCFMPLQIKDRLLTIAVCAPLDIKTQDEIRTQLGLNIVTVFSCSAFITEAMRKFYGLGADTIERMTSGVSAASKSPVPEAGREKIEDIEKLVGDASIIQLVNQIILEAWRKRATDIHIEPSRQGVNFRYRIDGMLYDANVPPEVRNFLDAIISRIKIMSNLDIMERRLPQDGRAVVKVQDQVLDLRISTLATPFGESVVIRILPAQMLFSLEKLGLTKKELEIFERLIQKPHGIIFVTGPTGSGKTTTLYAVLSRLNTKERKIITIEDPIEYEIPGITQIQVMPEIGLTFARGLRSVLRHDPDVMMVGEARDLETAETAIRVALTGHLVLSTLHTNDAASGITRLIDIGVEPYLVASSVEAFIAQRLIRMICPDCKDEDKDVSQELKEFIAEDAGIGVAEVKVFKGKGCPQCNFSGFWGRTALYEILLIDEEIQDMIMKKTPAGHVKKVALAKGMRSLRQDGWQKTLAGITTPQEVMKVTSSDASGEEGGGALFSYSSEEVASRPEAAKADRRMFIRLGAKINLVYKIIKSAQDLKQEGFKPEQWSVTKNISAGGLIFTAEEVMPLSSILVLKIELPDGEELIECLGRVVRIEEVEQNKTYDLAICFLDITGIARSRLKKFVDKETKG